MPVTDVDNCVRLGDAVIEPSLNQITINGKRWRVPKRDMDVLHFLMRHETRVISRDTLLNEVWDDVIVTDDAVTLSISRLRKAFGDDPRNPRVIETIPKRGYRLMIASQPFEVRRPWIFSKPSFWITTLGFLLVLVTVLFLLVRVEYERVGDLVEEQPVTEIDG